MNYEIDSSINLLKNSEMKENTQNVRMFKLF